MDELAKRTAKKLAGAASVREMASREGHADTLLYAVKVAGHIAGWQGRAPLDRQRERLEALAGAAGGPMEINGAIAIELAAHYALLEGLALGMLGEAENAKRPDVKIDYTQAALKCFAAAHRALGALKMLGEDMAFIKRKLESDRVSALEQ